MIRSRILLLSILFTAAIGCLFPILASCKKIFSEDRQQQQSGLKFGVLDRHGNEVFPPKFSWVSDFSNGYANAALWKAIKNVSERPEDYSPCNWHDNVVDTVILRKDGVLVKSIRETSLKAKLYREAVYPYRCVEAKQGCELIAIDGSVVGGPFSKCLAMSADMSVVANGDSYYLFIPKSTLKPLPSLRAAESGNSSKLFAVQTGTGCGAVGRDGKFIIPPKFSTISCTSNDIAFANAGGLSLEERSWLIYGSDGKLKTKETFSSVGSIQGALISVAVRKHGKELWGIINDNGQIVLAPEYQRVELFPENLAIVTDHTQNVRIFSTRSKSPGRQYTELVYIGNSLFAFRGADNNPAYGLVDLNDRVIKSRNFAEVVSNTRGKADSWSALASVLVNGKKRWGTINSQGRWLIEPKFASLIYLGSNIYAFRSGDDGSLYGLVDSRGNEFKAPRFAELTPNFTLGTEMWTCPASIFENSRQKWGWINAQGDWVIRPRYESAGNFSDGVAVFGVSP